MPSQQREPIVIGWTEFVDLPDWGIDGLRAKVDTGARTSALHAENIQAQPDGHVTFDVVLERKPRDRRVQVKARVIRRSRVKSSNGESSLRYFVETTLRLGPIEKRIELSLADRGKLTHRMLLGRAALQGRFLVDVARRMVLTRGGKGAPKRGLKTKTGSAGKPAASGSARKPTTKPRSTRRRTPRA